MRDINQLLEEMGRADADLEKEENDLTELEKYRIYKRTMEKIGEIDELDISEERENTEKEHFWKRVSKPAVAVAAAAVVCMVSVTAYAAFGLDDNIKHFFHIQDKQIEREIEQMVSQVDIKSESNGVTVATSQIIGDKTRFYTVLSATGLPDVPYELEFENTELTVSGANGETYDYTMQEPSMGIVAENKTKFGLLVSGINKDGEDIDVNGKNISLQLSNIGYYENDKKFVTLVKGEWKLNWVFYTQADNEKIDVNKEIQLMDSEGIWKDIVVSPISLTAHFTVTKQGKTHFSYKEWEKYEDSNRITIELTDGSRIDSRFADDVNESWGTSDKPGYKSIGFDKIVESDKIASITFGRQTVTLQESQNKFTRNTITAKAAKCSISFPEEISEMISVEEKSNVKNVDFNCKESYSIFWAQKKQTKMPFFTIHRLNGVFSEADLEGKNPMMTYIGYHGGDTYTIEYGEIQDEAQQKEFADILNTYISNILPFFEYA